MRRGNAILVDGNALRLGLFGSNCSSGRTYATLPERWEASWQNNARLAQLADEIGIECIVPIARWKGYGGESNPNGSSFESIAWACGLLAATRRINVFCTVHVPLHAGTYYKLGGVEGSPRPYAEGAPLMMNAGSSQAGRSFAIRHSDMHFDALDTPEASAGRIAETKRLAREHGRDIQVWTPVGIVCRPSQKEADDYLQYVVDHVDRGAIGYLAEMHAKDGRSPTDPQRPLMRSPIERRALARGSYCVVGDPDAVARELARLRSAGLDGVAANFVDYLKELPYFAGEVLPRLERLGLRTGSRLLRR